MRDTVLIVAQRDYHPADRVRRRLEERGARVVRFDPSDFPARARITVGFGDAPDFRLVAPDGTVELAHLRAVWLKASRMPGAGAPPIRDPVVRDFVDQDCSAFLSAAWDFLGPLCVPGPPSAMMAGQLKAPQLRRAMALGFEVPRTSFTNDPDAFLDLHRARNGRIVTKATGSLLMRREVGAEFFRYTEPVTTRDVAHAHAVALCPIIAQEYVPKRLELRVTVVGDDVFAAEIHSQQTHSTRHDWRRYDLGSTPHAVHDLPPDVEARCVALVKGSGLSYGTLDLILSPDGRYVLLELNSAGEYGWIEDLTGLPISEAIADLLLARGDGYELRAGASAGEEQRE